MMVESGFVRPYNKLVLLTDQTPVCPRAEEKFVSVLDEDEITTYYDADVTVLLYGLRSRLSMVITKVDAVLMKRPPFGKHNGIVLDKGVFNGFVVNELRESMDNPRFLLGRPLCNFLNPRRNVQKKFFEGKFGSGIIPVLDLASVYWDGLLWGRQRSAMRKDEGLP